MSSCLGMRHFAVGILAVASWSCASGAAHADGPEDGLKLAGTHCARCHVIGDGRTMNGIGSAPSFARLVNNLKDWEDRFATFFARPPHPAFVRLEGVDPPTALPPSASPVELTVEQSDAIYLYVQSLREE